MIEPNHCGGGEECDVIQSSWKWWVDKVGDKKVVGRIGERREIWQNIVKWKDKLIPFICHGRNYESNNWEVTLRKSARYAN